MTRWDDVVSVSVYFTVFVMMLKLAEASGNRWGRENDIAKRAVENAMSSFTLAQHETRTHERTAHLSAAHAYLTIALEVCNSVELERISGIDVHELGRAIAGKMTQTSLLSTPKSKHASRHAPRV